MKRALKILFLGLPWVLLLIVFGISIPLLLIGFIFIVGETLGTVILGLFGFFGFSVIIGLIVEDSNNPFDSLLSRWM